MPRWLPSTRAGSAWWLAWLALVLAGGATAVRLDIAQRREAFQADARVAHRLLSQRTSQHEAVLSTLALLGGTPTADASGPERRLSTIYPQLLSARRRDGQAPWPEAAWAEAEQRSRASGRAEVASFDPVAGRYALVLASGSSGFALLVDLQRTVPWDDWPLQRDGPVRVVLQQGTQAALMQAGEPARARPLGLTAGFTFAKPLSTPSQPFVLQLQRATGPAQWPWALLLAWAAACGVALAALAARAAGRRERQRAQQLLRLGQAARLGALGELAGGMAHELNQPLAAVLANTQAARRLLEDDPPPLDTVRDALGQSATQARRAADVVARLRRLVQAPDSARVRQPVHLLPVAQDAVALLQPEAQRRSIRLSVEGDAPAVLADPVALAQIVHNLMSNAMHALQQVPAAERRLQLLLHRDGDSGVLVVRDSGPGIADDALPHLFEPFFTTRPDGLGLGLSLSASLAQGMQGTLTVRPAAPRGTESTLALALADPPSP